MACVTGTEEFQVPNTACQLLFVRNLGTLTRQLVQKASESYAWQQVNFLDNLNSQDFSFKIHL